MLLALSYLHSKSSSTEDTSGFHIFVSALTCTPKYHVSWLLLNPAYLFPSSSLHKTRRCFVSTESQRIPSMEFWGGKNIQPHYFLISKSKQIKN